MSDELNLSNLKPAQARKDRKRVGRGTSLTTCPAGAFVITCFFIIADSILGKDKSQTLRYAIRPSSSMGAYGRQIGGCSHLEHCGCKTTQ